MRALICIQFNTTYKLRRRLSILLILPFHGLKFMRYFKTIFYLQGAANAAATLANAANGLNQAANGVTSAVTQDCWSNGVTTALHYTIVH